MKGKCIYMHTYIYIYIYIYVCVYIYIKLNHFAIQWKLLITHCKSTIIKQSKMKQKRSPRAEVTEQHSALHHCCI